MLRTHDCGRLSKQNIDQEVVLSGWVQRRRDLGGVLFIDLRDRSGLIQVVFNPAFSGDALAIADRVRNEYVITVKGKVVLRSAETRNELLPTGELEVQINEIEILNIAKNPPFAIEDDLEIDEMLRLKYRYLDLRRPQMQQNLMMRSKAAAFIRRFLDEQEFTEIETPILTKSTPEGARDYLVPSRVKPGEFFALPQSPQLYKQLLMVSGMEKYYQIARCFRDEDLRADRQPEFTQVDIEASFLSQEQLLALMEKMMAELFKEIKGIEVKTPFPRISYQEAMDKYGSDKPDLRFGLCIEDFSDLFKESHVKVFSQVIANGGKVKAINAKGCGNWSRKDIDDLAPYAARFGAKGLAWLQVKENELKGPIVKFLQPEEIAALKQQLKAEEGDLLLFSADQEKVVADVLGNLRLKIGKELGLIDPNRFVFAWVLDFPLVEYDAPQKRYVALHHPFTRPKDEHLSYFETNPTDMHAQAYDLVLNGYELGGGSQRIYTREVQEKMFELLGFTKEEAQEKFGFLLEAFEYGTPPHGGIALGLDRLIMLLAGCANLRETIAFPKAASSAELMIKSPSPVEFSQLRDLHIQVKESQKKE